MNAVLKPEDRIERLEETMLSMEQAPCDVVHSFAPGLYVRQVTLQAGLLAVGHRQKLAHLNVMLTGRVTMIEPDGSHSERAAPLVFVGEPGRKVGYVHEDVVWLNIYATDERDVAKLEAMFLDKSAAWQNAQQQLIGNDRSEDREDFKAAIEALGFSADQVSSQALELSDRMDFPPGSYGVKVAPSSIHGLGLIATRAFQSGELIAPARIGGKRTPAGRYSNHARSPNAVMRVDRAGNIALVALRDIEGCRGGQDGEEITVDYRESVKANRLSARSSL